ncbi:MAG: hypothetical protein K9L74_01660 [Candidatus Izimaplasma sp.]|nr:hypothetical protein [Candidatus Izimaplasma bacterium]
MKCICCGKSLELHLNFCSLFSLTYNIHPRCKPMQLKHVSFPLLKKIIHLHYLVEKPVENIDEMFWKYGGVFFATSKNDSLLFHMEGDSNLSALLLKILLSLSNESLTIISIERISDLI